MFKVLVVDDEPFMLEGWKTMVDWEACGYELCGAATDGEEALAWIRTCEPDLVVTDIQMPVLDGLELIRAIREDPGVDPTIVIVSGYSEFSYAQQALRYQVDHYVLKPLMTDEIHKLLLELAGPLEERRLAKKSAEKEQAAAAASAIVGLLKNGGAKEVEAAERLLGADERIGCRLLIAEAAASACGGAGKAGSVHARLQPLVEAAADAGLRFWPFEEAPSRTGLLVLGDERTEEHFTAWLLHAADEAGAALNDAAIYCSGGGRGLAAVPELYRQAMETRCRAPFGPTAGIHPYRERADHGDCGLEEITSHTEALLHAVEAGDAGGVGRSVDSLLRAFAGKGLRDGWRMAAVQHIRGELLRRYADLVADEASRDWTGETLKELCMRAAERQRAPDRADGSVIAEAVAYLNGHYRDKVQLHELAERCHLSPVYFGQQFKRETGTSFNDYVHRLRIGEARKLLRRTDMKVSDIASTLGYHDSQYFTDKFKALTGELPSSYKNKCKGERNAETDPVFP